MTTELTPEEAEYLKGVLRRLEKTRDQMARQRRADPAILNRSFCRPGCGCPRGRGV